ncbi:MAG: thioredoxin domain-containing protein [Anaerolineales bacterium]|nr:thioredoxin domain-containing protein [Anaerolineales bacterium]
MSPEKAMSKRQAMRAKRERQARVQQLGIIGIIVVGALLVAAALIYPSLRPVGEVFAANSGERPMVNDNAMGDPNAPIKVEEFSDYQCPFCARFSEETEGQIVEEYVAAGKVYFVYRSFGNFIGPESQAAAEAAYCAGDQDKYWEYHDILFANQTGENVGAYSDRRLQAFAESLSLDIDAFNSCFKGGKYADRVEQDYQDGAAAGVTGTPAFLITYTVNGEEKQRFIAGAYPFSEFQTQFDEALAEMGIQ